MPRRRGKSTPLTKKITKKVDFADPARWFLLPARRSNAVRITAAEKIFSKNLPKLS